MSKRSRDDTVLVGQAGTEYLQDLLSKTDAPLQAISDFQEKNGLAVPEVTVGTDLLRLHGLTNAQIHHHLLQKMLRDILENIKSFDMPQIESLLQRTYPFLAVPELQKVPLALLAAHKRLPQALLKSLASMDDVYSVLPLSTKQQIWSINNTKFKEEAFQLFLAYAEASQAVVMSIHARPTLEPARRRTENRALQQVQQTVGEALELYTQMLELIKTYYMDTRMPIFCTLRCELLMTVHDKGITPLYQADPCHRLAWLLDAAVRDDSFETRQLKEIETYMKKYDRNPEVYADLSMVLADPITFHMLIRNICKLLRVIVDKEGIPREDHKLMLVTKLALLGTRSVAIIEEQQKPGLKTDDSIVNEFYPLISEVILDDDIREPGDDPEDFDPQLSTFFASSALARAVCFMQALSNIQRKDITGFLHWATLFAEHPAAVLTESAYAHSLCTVLVQHATSSDHGWDSIINTGFIPFVQEAEWHGQVLRLLQLSHVHIPAEVIVSTLSHLADNTIFPEDHAALKVQYEELKVLLVGVTGVSDLVDACIAKCS